MILSMISRSAGREIKGSICLSTSAVPLAVAAASAARKGTRLASLLLAMAVVRATATLTLLFQSLIRRSLVSGSCIICCVALPTECNCHMPMAVITTANASTTAKPRPRRAPILNLEKFIASIHSRKEVRAA